MANQIAVQIYKVGASTSEAAIRGHRLLIDRPTAKGGSDAGPMGGELFLASVGGCFMSNLLAAIKPREVTAGDIRAEITGTLADSPARFTSIQLNITAAGVSQEQLSHLVDIADRGCIMMNTLRDRMEIRIQIGPSDPR
jgi:putative redox protein